MLNELSAFIARYDLLRPGDRVICALSGGADSVAMTYGLWLLRERLGIELTAAHFNHHLRGAESERDEAFVRALCNRWEIPLTVGGAQVVPGKKGLEAAAREARYAFLRTLPGILATAHTADDNAETVLLHLVRGTGLRGLGGITPKAPGLIRPMLGVTRAQVLAFLEEYSLPHVDDSSNETDAFLRNRLRRSVMPLLRAENPALIESMSAMALELREDEAALSDLAGQVPDRVAAIAAQSPAVQARVLARILRDAGVREPERRHIRLAQSLVQSPNPSAKADFPGGVTLTREYDRLCAAPCESAPQARMLPCPGVLALPLAGVRVHCRPAQEIVRTYARFTVRPVGAITVRTRLPGDAIRLCGGTKPLKKLFIDRKIPAQKRPFVPVLADDEGILAVVGIGANLDRLADSLPAVEIRIEPL